MSDFFRVYKATQSRVPAYFIESTAPNNVDDTVASNSLGDPSALQLIPDPQQAINEIAEALAKTKANSKAKAPNLVVMVHGFNNPRPNVLAMYEAAAAAINRDPAIMDRGSVVCVGYRWPSEKMWGIFRSSWAALPILPSAIVLTSALLLALTLFVLSNANNILIVILSGSTFVVLMLIVLRACVYYRDVYRATNYGVPDLIEIIRSIDSAIVGHRGRKWRGVQLSLIGHSMGGLVVTNAIRTLSDVFAGPTAPLSHYGLAGFKKGQGQSGLSHIGNVFTLKRFILASPDIPAQTLLSSRSNFLASSLMRFKEAYLFSNEGDEVLRQISTLANFFTFPTISRSHGYRLGNVEILSNKLGIVNIPNTSFLKVLRIGKLTLQQLYNEIQKAAGVRDLAAAKRDPTAKKPLE